MYTIHRYITNTFINLINDAFTQYIGYMFIDGEQVSISSTKTFSSIGEHTVQMIMNTSNVSNMNNMFSGCTALTSIEFNDTFDTSNVTTMYGIFNNCKKLTSLDLSSFDTSKVTDMSQMFQDCSGLTSIEFGYYSDVSKVTSYRYMFSSVPTSCTLTLCENTIDGWNKLISSYTLNVVENICYTPTECTELTISANDVSCRATSTIITYTAVTNGIFYGEEYNGMVITGTVKSEQFEQNTDTANTITHEVTFEYLGVTASTTFTQGVWANYDVLLTINATNTTSSYSLMNNNFNYVTDMYVDDINVTPSSSIRFDSIGEHTIGLYFNSSSITSMKSMFSGMTHLISVEFSETFDTSNVTNMHGLFFMCTNMLSADLSYFNTSNVTDMRIMFSHQSVGGDMSFTSITLSNNWDMRKVTDIDYMFNGCNDLTSITLGYYCDVTMASSYTDPFYSVPSSCLIQICNNVKDSWNKVNKPSNIVYVDCTEPISE